MIWYTGTLSIRISLWSFSASIITLVPQVIEILCCRGGLAASLGQDYSMPMLNAKLKKNPCRCSISTSPSLFRSDSLFIHYLLHTVPTNIKVATSFRFATATNPDHTAQITSTLTRLLPKSIQSTEELQGQIVGRTGRGGKENICFLPFPFLPAPSPSVVVSPLGPVSRRPLTLRGC